MRRHSILTCWGFLPQNLHHKTQRFAHFRTPPPEYHNLTQRQKTWRFHGDFDSPPFLNVTEASGRLSSQASTNAHAEPGAYAFFMGSLCHAPKFPKAFLKQHCLDVGGAFLATQECGGYSVHHLHPFILRYSLSSLCPSGVTPCGRHHPGSLPRRGLAEKVISGERGRSG